MLMSTFSLPHLTALLAQLDALADDAWRAGDEHQERYYTIFQNHLRIKCLVRPSNIEAIW